MKVLAKLFILIMIFLGFGCNSRVIYEDDKYRVQEFPFFMSYYQASPDLFVKTDTGTFRIKLSWFGKTIIPQERIQTVVLRPLTHDSLDIRLLADTIWKKEPEQNFIISVSEGVRLSKQYQYK